MVQPYIGEVRMFGGSFAPATWAFCNGQSLSIATYQALYSLIGTTYGGNGTTTFNLPNLQGRLCVGMGQGPGLSNYTIGQAAGTETVTLSVAQMPMHPHSLNATTTTASLGTPVNNLTGNATPLTPSQQHMYTTTGSPSPTLGNLNVNACSFAGGSQPHNNLMPSLCVSFIIALFGIFPSRG
jgi:microcystin-dependent protein